MDPLTSNSPPGSLSSATHRVTVYWLKLISNVGIRRVEASKERGRIGTDGGEWEIFVMKYGGTNDTRIKARLRNEAELKSRRARKKEDKQWAHSTFYRDSEPSVGVYLFINWKEIELPFHPALLLSPHFFSLFLCLYDIFLFPSFQSLRSSFFFSAMEVESRQERGFADKSAERERKRERERGRGKERERERERSCGRKKRIEIAQDFRTEMEVRYRKPRFSSSRIFSRAMVHEIMFPRNDG